MFPASPPERATCAAGRDDRGNCPAMALLVQHEELGTLGVKYRCHIEQIDGVNRVSSFNYYTLSSPSRFRHRLIFTNQRHGFRTSRR